MKQEKSNTKKIEIIEYINKVYLPEKTSMGNQLYSGRVDAESYCMGWQAAKNNILSYLKDVL